MGKEICFMKKWICRCFSCFVLDLLIYVLANSYHTIPSLLLPPPLPIKKKRNCRLPVKKCWFWKDIKVYDKDVTNNRKSEKKHIGSFWEELPLVTYILIFLLFHFMRISTLCSTFWCHILTILYTKTLCFALFYNDVIKKPLQLNCTWSLIVSYKHKIKSPYLSTADHFDLKGKAKQLLVYTI